MNKISLFFWQRCFICWLIGLLFIRFSFYSFLLFIIIFCLFFSKDYKKIFFLLFSYLLGIIYIYINIPSFWINKNINFFYKKHKIEGNIKNIVLLPEKRIRFILNKLKIDNNFNSHNLILDYQVKDKSIDDILHVVDIGDRISGIFKIKPLVGLKNNGYTGYAFYWLSKNIFFKVYTNKKNFYLKKINKNIFPKIIFKFWKNIRTKLIYCFQDIEDFDIAKGIAFCLLLNDKSFLSYYWLNFIQDYSLGHTLALSGLHLSIVFGFGFALAWIVSFIFPEICNLLPRKKIGIGISLFLSLMYLLISRFPVSLVRAEIMFLSWAILYLINRKHFFIDGYFIAMAIILIVCPYMLFDISFQFSFLAVFGIYLIYVNFLQKIKFKTKLYYFLLSLLCASVAANLFILPLQIYYFNKIYTLSILLNLIWIPILTFIVLPTGFLGILFLYINSNIAKLLFYVMLYCINIFIKFLEFIYYHFYNIFKYHLSFRPDGLMMIIYYSIIFIIFIKYRQKLTLFFLTVLIIIYFFINYNKNQFISKLSVFDVGQGQSILYTNNINKILIDGGGSVNFDFDFGKQILSKILTYKNFPKLDKIFLTHPDIDHLRGLYYILKNFKYNNFYFTGELPTGNKDRKKFLSLLKNINYSYVFQNNIIKLGKNSYLKIIHPPKKVNFAKINNKSLVFQIFEKNRPIFLVCGDIERQGLKYLVHHVKNLATPVLILPHHGSKSSFYPLFYQKVSPKIVIISCGLLNRFKFPAKQILTYFRKRKIKIYTTSYLGEIDVFYLGKRIKIQSSNKLLIYKNKFFINN
ncbi:MAG: DNA internalization-related competence protein ComEC/Rec2 [Desulfonauticus sp.]|nr:DNA internalization-related competence protein ComEC/Rec2 [Desulfonauticus sp.]